MVAKNTIEILKTIKKKIQKFDGKPQIEDHEIEHIEPFEVHAEKQMQAQNQTLQPQNQMPKFEDDLGLGDLDDETAFKQKADTNQKAVVMKTQQAVTAPQEEKHEEWDEHKLAEYDAEIERLLAKETKNHKQTQPMQNVDVVEVKVPTPTSPTPLPPVVATQPQDDIEKELAELDAQLLNQHKQVVSKEVPQENAAPELHDDDLEDDLLFDDDLEMHDEKKEEVHVEENESEDEDYEDFSLDDSDNDIDIAPSPYQQPQQLTPNQTPQNQEVQHEDEFDFEELEHEADEIAAKQVENIVIPQEKIHDNHEVDEFDRELEMAESSITKIPLSQLRNHLQKRTDDVLEEKHEVDLEFEKEFYNAPSVSAASPAPVSYDRTESNLHGADDLREVARAAQYEMPKMQQSGLLNDVTILQTTESLKKLLDAKSMIGGISDFTKDPALRQVALQILEPKLERWLNENLAHIVEDIVRDEIRKITPRG